MLRSLCEDALPALRSPDTPRRPFCPSSAPRRCPRCSTPTTAPTRARSCASSSSTSSCRPRCRCGAGGQGGAAGKEGWAMAWGRQAGSSAGPARRALGLGQAVVRLGAWQSPAFWLSLQPGPALCSSFGPSPYPRPNHCTAPPPYVSSGRGAAVQGHAQQLGRVRQQGRLPDERHPPHPVGCAPHLCLRRSASPLRAGSALPLSHLASSLSLPASSCGLQHCQSVALVCCLSNRLCAGQRAG